MRKNFYELLTQREFDAKKEYATLWTLFCVEKSYHTGYGSYAMAPWVDQKLFRDFTFRGSFTTLKEMMDKILQTSKPSIPGNNSMFLSALLTRAPSDLCPLSHS